MLWVRRQGCSWASHAAGELFNVAASERQVQPDMNMLLVVCRSNSKMQRC